MKGLPIVLSATALMVVLFGSTPVGHAVSSKVPFFAKTAGYANRAGTAATLKGVKVSKQPLPGRLLPLGDEYSEATPPPRAFLPLAVDLPLLRLVRLQISPLRQVLPAADACGTASSRRARRSVRTYGPRRARSTLRTGWPLLSPVPLVSLGTRHADDPDRGGELPVSAYTTRIYESAPAGAATGWVVGVYHNTTRTQRFYAWVICAYVAS